MDKEKWFFSRQKLISLLETQKKQLIQIQNDIEEIEFCIESYGSKVGDFVPEPLTEKDLVDRARELKKESINA